MEPQNTEEEINAKVKYKEALHQGMAYSINKFDDQILYISTGALVLSMSFIGTTVNLANAQWILLLYSSWILLVVTAMVSVHTHLQSYHLHSKQADRLEKGEELVIIDEKTVSRNKIMFISLTVGICLQVLFVIINIQHMKNVTNKGIGNPATTKPDSIKVPSPGALENLALPVMQVPIVLRPTSDSSSTGNGGTKK